LKFPISLAFSCALYVRILDNSIDQVMELMDISWSGLQGATRSSHVTVVAKYDILFL